MLNNFKALYIFLTFSFLFSANEIEARVKLAKSIRKDQESVKELNRVLICTRRFIGERRGGTESVVRALVYLKRSGEIFGDAQLMSELRKACESELSEVATVPATTTEELNKKLVEQIGIYPEAAIDVVSKFIVAGGSCRFVSFGFNVGFIASFGIGLKAFKCDSEDGRRFIAMAPELADGMGFGATIAAGGGKLNLEKVETSRLTGVYEEHSNTNGVIVVLHDAESHGEVKYVVKEKAYGLGLGFFSHHRRFPLLKVLGQTDHFEELINHLLNL